MLIYTLPMLTPYRTGDETMDTAPLPLLRLYAQTFRRYRLAGLTVSQAMARAREDVLDGQP